MGAAVQFGQWTLGGARGTDLSGGAQAARARLGVHAAPEAGGTSPCAVGATAASHGGHAGHGPVPTGVGAPALPRLVLRGEGRSPGSASH